jgi:hypothetical protein
MAHLRTKPAAQTPWAPLVAIADFEKLIKGLSSDEIISADIESGTSEKQGHQSRRCSRNSILTGPIAR